MVSSEESRRLFAGKIRAESQRMSKLVEDIIGLSQLDGGGTGMTREFTDLYRIAANAAESLMAAAADAGVTLAVEGESAVMYGVPQVLYSIIYNLCSNAVHYSNSGGRVLVTVRDYRDKAELTVADNVLPGRQEPFQGSGRHRPGPFHCQTRRHGARRTGQRRKRTRQRLCFYGLFSQTSVNIYNTPLNIGFT